MAEMTTFNNMGLLEREIRVFIQANHRLPASLAEIHQMMDEGMDGWHNPISYSPQPDGSVLLSSHGPGGANQVFSIQIFTPGLPRQR
jgi:hypothetical protein